ncbi:MAG: alpha/beta fold hydrolase [Niveispirillum sp.]|uniref:alpha/beta fold hydrolase n=1 Tax=Niveispirillum sp. TaxID=1917217 RepID=UPI003BA6F9EE
MRVDLPGADGVILSTLVAGAADAPPLLLLHGFPDLAQGWSRLIPFLADDYRLYAPDLRGYGASSRPERVADYGLPSLLADLVVLITAIGQPVTLVGNDWGGVLGWCMAERRPDLLAGLIALNAPHPFILNRALRSDPVQRAAASYLTALRQDGVEQRLMADDFALLFGALEEGPPQGANTLSPSERDIYRAAWSMPGAVTAMVNWYRMADFADPAHILPTPKHPLTLPTLLIWGDRDRALLAPLAMAHLDIHPTSDLRLLADQGHWPHRTDPAGVAALIRGFTPRTAP